VEWDKLIEIITQNIQIIGVFVAIILGFITTKLIELKKEKEEVQDKLEEIENELEVLSIQFTELQQENYEVYKQDYVSEIVESILKKEKYEFSENIPYVSMDKQKEFYTYVKDYGGKVSEILIEGKSDEECKEILKCEQDSIEEDIIDQIYDWRGE